jgi:SAM-dependent methyltransferase
LTPEVFDKAFAEVQASDWARRVIGDGVPDGVDPYSFITAAGLEEIAATLSDCRGSTIVDLACGRGGPGLWIARRVGAFLVGVDFSPVGIAQARQRASQAASDVRAEYRVADAASTGLRNESAAGLFCIDAIQLMPDQEAVIREVARLLQPGAHAVFTTWERRERLPDLAALFDAGGLDVLAVEERRAWSDRERAIFERALTDAPLYPEDSSLQDLADEASRALPGFETRRRVIGTARKPIESAPATG